MILSVRGLFPQDITWREVEVEHFLIVHVGCIASQCFGQGLVSFWCRIAQFIEQMAVGTLQADEITLLQQSDGIAVFDIGYRFRGLNTFGKQTLRIGEGADALGLTDACGINQVIQQTRLAETLDIQRCAVIGLEALDEVSASAIDISAAIVHDGRQLTDIVAQVLVFGVDADMSTHDSLNSSLGMALPLTITY